MFPSNSITLVNHASVLIKGLDKSILTDPWYWGDAFHKGWSLMHENESIEIDALLNEASFIWLSHEHPDHFSIPFFKRYKKKIQERGIKVIFQDTRDKRVRDFLQREDIFVQELAEGLVFNVEKRFSISIVKDDFYDSALLVRIGDHKIFNLNDCHFPEETKIRTFKKRYGDCDVLLTQFSYAAWKGGRDNRPWREAAAHEKLEGLCWQAKILNAKIVIPFASFVRFSNEFNSYLNDAANRPRTVLAACNESPYPFNAIFLSPMETILLDQLEHVKQDPASVSFWEQKFAEDFTTLKYEKSINLTELEQKFLAYCQRVEKNNAHLLMMIASKVPMLEIFNPVVVKLVDSDLALRIDIPKRSITRTKDMPDVALHSQSLAFIFENAFGFDTLTVNGNFEETSANGFARFTKNFAIENLNNLGYRLDFLLLFNFRLISIFLGRLWAVANKLRQHPSS